MVLKEHTPKLRIEFAPSECDLLDVSLQNAKNVTMQKAYFLMSQRFGLRRLKTTKKSISTRKNNAKTVIYVKKTFCRHHY